MPFNTKFCGPISSLLAAVLLALPATNLQANETEIATALIELSGVGPHLADVGSIVFEEALPSYRECFSEAGGVMSPEDEQKLKSALEQNLGSTVTVQRAITELAQAMELSDLEAVQDFFNTPSGVRIVEAETASKEFDEVTFFNMQKAYFASSVWTEERTATMSDVHDSTRAVRFVSTLNGEISVAITLSGHCDATKAEFEKLQPQLDSLRSESQFVEPIMRGDMILVIAVIFKDITNDDLNNYIEFSQSDVGVRFFNALLASTEAGIAGGLSGLQESLLR